MMKKIGWGFTLVAIALAILSCDRDDLHEADYIVFGHFYGHCVGEECIELFKLDQEHIYEDTRDQYPSTQQAYQGEFVEMPSQVFERVSAYDYTLPEFLLNSQDTVFGMPDAGDWGGLYFERQRGESHRYWLIDLNKTYADKELHSFIDELLEMIELAKE